MDQARSGDAIPALAGLALSTLPRAALDPALSLVLAALCERHPEVLARLDGFAGATVLIDPVELPVALVLTLGAATDATTLRAVDKHVHATTTVRGPFRVLQALLEGRLDGDGAFFARQLAVEGDTELLLALRNAVDAAEVDLARDLAHALTALLPSALASAALRGLAAALATAGAGAADALWAALAPAIHPAQGATRGRGAMRGRAARRF